MISWKNVGKRINNEVHTHSQRSTNNSWNNSEYFQFFVLGRLKTLLDFIKVEMNEAEITGNSWLLKNAHLRHCNNILSNLKRGKFGDKTTKPPGIWLSQPEHPKFISD